MLIVRHAETPEKKDGGKPMEIVRPRQDVRVISEKLRQAAKTAEEEEPPVTGISFDPRTREGRTVVKLLAITGACALVLAGMTGVSPMALVGVALAMCGLVFGALGTVGALQNLFRRKGKSEEQGDKQEDVGLLNRDQVWPRAEYKRINSRDERLIAVVCYA